MYDYLIVGAGISGAAMARVLTDGGKSCLVIDRRRHIAGNVYSEKVDGIEVHRYGPHIFHTDNEKVWAFINRFASFNHFIYSPVANYRGELYNLPFNMNTFHALWGVNTPAEAQAIIEKQRKEAGIDEPRNLEEQAIALVGTFRPSSSGGFRFALLLTTIISTTRIREFRWMGTRKWCRICWRGLTCG